MAVYSGCMRNRKPENGAPGAPDPFDPFGRTRTASGPETHACAMPGCSQQGEYRAPRDRGLTDYIWLCLDHVRSYNRQWNYYENMSPQELEDEIRKDYTWQRPTWKLGTLGGGADRNGSARFRDHFGFFDPERDEAEAGRSRWHRNGHKSQPDNPEERKALETLDLHLPLDINELRTRYRALVKEHHPDLNHDDPDAEERFKTISDAYHTLLAGLKAPG